MSSVYFSFLSQGFAEILIDASDLSRALIGFDKDSLNVQVDEDASPHEAELKLIRSNSLTGNVTVGLLSLFFSFNILCSLVANVWLYEMIYDDKCLLSTN